MPRLLLRFQIVVKEANVSNIKRASNHLLKHMSKVFGSVSREVYEQRRKIIIFLLFYGTVMLLS